MPVEPLQITFRSSAFERLAERGSFDVWGAEHIHEIDA